MIKILLTFLIFVSFLNADNITINKANDKITLEQIMIKHPSYVFLLDDTVNIKKEYPLSKLSDNWLEEINDIVEYEDYYFEFEKDLKTIKISAKVKDSIIVKKISEKDITKLVNMFNNRFKKANAYVYGNKIYIEGSAIEVAAMKKLIKNLNNKIIQDNYKYIVKLYVKPSNITSENGIVPKLETFYYSPFNKIVFKEPKHNFPYSIKVMNKNIILKFYVDYITIDNVKYKKSDINEYGFVKDDLYLDIKTTKF
jgi:hypothetical protein